MNGSENMRTKLVSMVLVTIIILVSFVALVGINLGNQNVPTGANTLVLAPPCHTEKKRDQPDDSCCLGTDPPGNTGVIATVKDSRKKNNITRNLEQGTTSSLENLAGSTIISAGLRRTLNQDVPIVMLPSMKAAAPPCC